jgi:hypothetical protein
LPSEICPLAPMTLTVGWDTVAFMISCIFNLVRHECLSIAAFCQSQAFSIGASTTGTEVHAGFRLDSARCLEQAHLSLA